LVGSSAAWTRPTPTEVTRIDGPGESPRTSEAIAAPGSSRTRMKSPGSMPSRIGRFMIVRKLGEGGMGVVYYAYDPKLDRPVALKLLHPAMRRDTNSHGEARLLREAQAMARLSHPNVVQVFEAGEFEDAVYLAMEYIEGQDLRTWLGVRARPWREIAAVFLQAGHGLAAAHEAGVIHRDFKPDNVLVGDDGRVRVLDFGLARPAVGGETEEHTADGAAHSSHKITLTKIGAYIGTPAYMSPEQHLCQPADARSDQFSFCVGLYEALYGHRPFHGSNASDVRLAVFRGAPPLPADRKVPKHLRQLLARGLAIAAADRFPDMRPLLAALAVDPARTRGRMAIGLATLTLGATGAIGSGMWAEEQRCTHGADSLIPVWNQARADQARRAFLATGLPYAAETWPKVQAHIDVYARAWAHQRDQFCAATHLRGEASANLLDLRNACLDDGLRNLDALVDALETADAATVERALQSVASLTPLAACNDDVMLHERVKPPSDPELAAAVSRARALLARATARRDAGRPRESREIAAAVGRSSVDLDHPPLRAEAPARARPRRGGHRRLRAGAHAPDRGLSPRAGDQARRRRQRRRDRAQPRASPHGRLRGGLRVVGARAQSLAAHRRAPRTSACPYLLYRSYALTRLGLHVDATVAAEEALALPGPTSRPVTRGSVACSRASPTPSGRAATRHRARAVSSQPGRLARGLSPDHPAVASSGINISTIHLQRHEFAAALAAVLPALTIMERSFGPDHPSVADALTNLGAIADGQGGCARRSPPPGAPWRSTPGASVPDSDMALRTLIDLGDQENRLGRPEAALGDLRRARSMLRHAGDQPDLLALAEAHIGDVLLTLHRRDEAALAYHAALTALGPAAGPDDRAHALRGLARLARERGEPAQAEALARGALVPVDPETGPDEARTLAAERAATLTELGEALRALGRLDEARAACVEAVALEDMSHGPDGWQSAACLLCLGRVEQARGQWQAALTAFERAAAILGRSDVAPHTRAAAHEALALALREVDPARSRELAQRAAAGYLAAGPAHVADLARATALAGPRR
jgi:tetratricopeptide (TPR) repeat protein